MYYTDSELCGSKVDRTSGYPQRKNNAPWEHPFILMLDRGSCSFTEKVRNAQKAGAAAALIADTSCVCSDLTCMNFTNAAPGVCKDQEPIMADDGTGGDISIPSFLVYKHDAIPIIETLKQNLPVQVEMKFSVPTTDSRVEYELWTAPRDVVSRNMIMSFQDAAMALGNDAFFTPHEFVMDGEKAGCQQNGQDVCFNLCTNEGKYCALDPDGDVLTGATGADVVAESLRRICIWEVYGKDGVGQEWWTYVSTFMTMCDDKSNAHDTSRFKDPACIANAMVEAGVDSHKVQECIVASGGLEGNVNNTLFQKQQARIDELGVILIPSLFINQAPIRGSLTFDTTFEAICAGYATGYEPEICKQCRTCTQDMHGCVKRGGTCADDFFTQDGGVSLPFFATSFLSLTLIFLCYGYVVYRRQQQAMAHQVREIMAQYVPLEDEEDDEGMGRFTITQASSAVALCL